jgi:hypothetical protein
MQKIQVLTGTALSLLIATASLYPATAAPVGELAQRNMMSPENTTGKIRGKVKSIVGDLITMELPNGETKTISVPRRERERLALQPGTEILVSSSGTEIELAPRSVATSETTRTTTTITPSTTRTTTTTTTTTTVTPTRTNVTPLPQPVRVETPTRTFPVSQPVRVQPTTPVIIPQAW